MGSRSQRWEVTLGRRTHAPELTKNESGLKCTLCGITDSHTHPHCVVKEKTPTYITKRWDQVARTESTFFGRVVAVATECEVVHARERGFDLLRHRLVWPVRQMVHCSSEPRHEQQQHHHGHQERRRRHCDLRDNWRSREGDRSSLAGLLLCVWSIETSPRSSSGSMSSLYLMDWWLACRAASLYSSPWAALSAK